MHLRSLSYALGSLFCLASAACAVDSTDAPDPGDPSATASVG